MLVVNIPPDGLSGLTFSTLGEYDIPAPPNGFKPEENNTVLMQFDNEQQALDYAEQINTAAVQIEDKNSPEYLILSDVVNAINNDAFVKAYNGD